VGEVLQMPLFRIQNIMLKGLERGKSNSFCPLCHMTNTNFQIESGENNEIKMLIFLKTQVFMKFHNTKNKNEICAMFPERK
jgi:hypothetical protein